MLKAGVLGAGHFGKIHLSLLNQSSKFELIGFYDTDLTHAKQVYDEFGYRFFETLDKLLDAVEVVIIATPTATHFECAKTAILKGKHVFIEKPITSTVDEANELITLTKKHKVKGMVGHVERFNQAFLTAEKYIKKPMFIESHRLSEFNKRGNDVPVILDLMIHDIDIILSLVKSDIKRIAASGATVISKSTDIANARIEFENGCIVNLTSNRISMKNMRKCRIFQKDAYISIDFLAKKTKVVTMKNATSTANEALILETSEGIKKQLIVENPTIIENNAILDELESFADAINQNTEPMVTLKKGTEALKIALQIIKNFNHN